MPKRLRDELRLEAGQPLDIHLRDGRIEIEVPSMEMRLERRGGRLVAVAERPVPPLTAEDVRETVERLRR